MKDTSWKLIATFYKDGKLWFKKYQNNENPLLYKTVYDDIKTTIYRHCGRSKKWKN